MSGPRSYSVTEYVQAWKVTAENLREVADWCSGRAGEVEGVVDFPSSRDGDIDTAEPGQYVVKGLHGFFAVDGDVLERQYDLAEPPHPEIRGVLTGNPLNITRRP